MRIFKNPWFSRFAAREGITDAELRDIADQIETGRADADLGGGVYKVRIGRPGAGKSGGYRVIVFFKSGKRTFYVYGFAKSARANISTKELAKLKQRAKTRLSMTDEQIKAALKAGVFEEI